MTNATVYNYPHPLLMKALRTLSDMVQVLPIPRGTLTRSMLPLLMLLLRSTRKINSPGALRRSSWAVRRSGQKFSMTTGWWGMSLFRRFLMISVCREEGEGRRRGRHPAAPLHLEGVHSVPTGGDAPSGPADENTSPN